MIWIWVLSAIGVIFILIAIYYINQIRILENEIQNARSQINVQLKRRADLVPNLVSIVKGYAKHERKIFLEISKAREKMLNARSLESKIKEGNALTSALKTLFAISENYPNLKANENFLQLQEQLSNIENKIAYARQYYNDSVLRYNNLITTIPGKFFAKNKKPKKYLEIEVTDTKPPKIEY